MHRRRRRGLILLPLLALLVLLTVSLLFFRSLTTQVAVSDAVDTVNKAVNDAVRELIGGGDYALDYFVMLSKDESGQITAISGNMAHINGVSAEILDRVMQTADDGVIEVGIPLGNLFGSNLLSGRGPDVKVEIVMLTSSRTDFKTLVSSAGINQNEYQILLEITMDIDVLVPGGTQSAQTVTEVILADTVIVGSVPDTYFNMENDNGRTEGDN